MPTSATINSCNVSFFLTLQPSFSTEFMLTFNATHFFYFEATVRCNSMSHCLCQACDDVTLFVQLSDELLQRTIQNSRSPGLAEARDILGRIVKRNFYKLVGG